MISLRLRERWIRGSVARHSTRAEPPVASARVGVYRPRRLWASPLYRMLEEHFSEFSTVYDDRFAR